MIMYNMRGVFYAQTISQNIESIELKLYGMELLSGYKKLFVSHSEI
jgi:hypothetical protein